MVAWSQASGLLDPAQHLLNPSSGLEGLSVARVSGGALVSDSRFLLKLL